MAIQGLEQSHRFQRFRIRTQVKEKRLNQEIPTRQKERIKLRQPAGHRLGLLKLPFRPNCNPIAQLQHQHEY